MTGYNEAFMRHTTVDTPTLLHNYLQCSVYFRSCFVPIHCNIGCVESKNMQSPRSFQLGHYFGTAGVPTQLPQAKTTGSSGKKVGTQHHPARHCFDQ